MTAEIAGTSRFSSCPILQASLVGAGHVHLGDDEQLGAIGQRLAVLGQLVADRPVVLDGVAAVHRHGLDEVDQQRRPLDVTQELVAQPVPGVGTLDQSGDIGHDEGPIPGDDAFPGSGTWS